MGNICYKWNPDGVWWYACECNSCRARRHSQENRRRLEERRDSKTQDSRKVHDAKGKNYHSRDKW